MPSFYFFYFVLTLSLCSRVSLISLSFIFFPLLSPHVQPPFFSFSSLSSHPTCPLLFLFCQSFSPSLFSTFLKLSPLLLLPRLRSATSLSSSKNFWKSVLQRKDRNPNRTRSVRSLSVSHLEKRQPGPNKYSPVRSRSQGFPATNRTVPNPRQNNKGGQHPTRPTKIGTRQAHPST